MKNTFRQLIFLSVYIILSFSLIAQNKKPSLRDSLDGAFDVSDYVIEAHGFIPVPIIITEPALGGFGVGFVPVFIKKRPPYIDSVKGQLKYTPVAPDITGALALYTVNNSWLTAAFRQGTLIKSGIKYRIGGGYGNINMGYYRALPQVGEKKFEFNIKTYVGFVQQKSALGFLTGMRG